MNNIIRNILRFVLLLLIQILICNHIVLWNVITPQIYIFALLLLPMQTPKWAQYLIAFIYGFIIDCFLQTLGIHAAACLILTTLRPLLIMLMNGRKLPEDSFLPLPGIKSFGWLLTFFLLMTFIHQFLIGILEAFTFREFFKTLLYIVANTICTTFINLSILHIFFYEKRIK